MRFMLVSRVRLALLLAALAAFAMVAHAAAPQVKGQAPGYYRMMLGDFEVTVLSDGTLPLPVDQLLTNTTPAKLQKALARSFQAAPIETSVNAFLINTGAKLVLVDAGTGKLFGPTLGQLLSNLKAAGYQPEQVDDIVITHMHPDHVGGLMAGEQRAFPNAVVHADQQDADFWLSSANLEKAPATMQDFFKGAQASLGPYVQAGKLQTFNGDTEIVPGVRARAARGHTPGHAIYVVESKGQKLVLWGDLLHVAAVQFADPSVTIRFDVDAKAAMAQRKRAFAEAAKEGYWIGSAHLAFPGLGHLRAEGPGYVFVPANYAVPR
jgi:glyoxylase-like metal-dependent hydrolase (beta-lactamase superfamily II)